MEEKLVAVINETAEVLNIAQLKKLQEVMLKHFAQKEAEKKRLSNEEYTKYLDIQADQVICFTRIE